MEVLDLADDEIAKLSKDLAASNDLAEPNAGGEVAKED